MNLISIIRTRQELEKCYPIMKELRPHLKFDDYISIYDQAHRADGYEIVALMQNQQIVALMGYRILYDYVRGKHLYIDDLVTTQKMQSQGFGAELLQYAEQIASQEACHILRLCTGIENERGVLFYEKNAWTKRAYAYTKKLSKTHGL